MAICPHCGKDHGGASASNGQGRSEKSNVQGRNTFAMGIEKTGTTTVTYGTQGGTITTPSGKTTVHARGDVHHHGSHSTNPSKGNFDRSGQPHSGVAFSLFKFLTNTFNHKK